ncbi:MAG: hypothetical protein P8182_00970 [Deltaproteobacteria bacterium]
MKVAFLINCGEEYAENGAERQKLTVGGKPLNVASVFPEPPHHRAGFGRAATAEITID